MTTALAGFDSDLTNMNSVECQTMMWLLIFSIMLIVSIAFNVVLIWIVLGKETET